MAEEQRTLTALVVEDDESLRESLITALSVYFPYLNIQTAVNGEDAYNKIKLQKPDILYTDVRMPIMSGDQLLEKLVEEQVKIPTFVVTAAPSTDQSISAISYSHMMYTDDLLVKLGTYFNRKLQEHGGVNRKENLAFTVIPKPFDLLELVDRTQAVLNVVYGIDTNI